MVKEVGRYACEICKAVYDDRSEAMACEARGKPTVLPVGTMYFYSPSTVYGVVESRVHGHGSAHEAQVFRDTPGDDNDNKWGVRSTGLKVALIEAVPAEGLTRPCLKRLAAALKANGIEPLVWDGTKAVPYQDPTQTTQTT